VAESKPRYRTGKVCYIEIPAVDEDRSAEFYERVFGWEMRRLSRSGAEDVENLGGWLTTIVARMCLNMLRSRSHRREEPLAVHLPDPVISRTLTEGIPLPADNNHTSGHGNGHVIAGHPATPAAAREPPTPGGAGPDPGPPVAPGQTPAG
jgi:DNA-directed RNA polymerase specialized sigma24 family protein